MRIPEFVGAKYKFAHPTLSSPIEDEGKILLSIIIPVFNESKRIHHLKNVVAYCHTLGVASEIIVVDDGSTDATVDFARKHTEGHPQMRIISLDNNFGKGYAIARGMEIAKGTYHLFMDIDMSTPLSYIEKALEQIQSADVVIGTRKIREARLAKRQPFIRETLGKGFTLLSQILLNTPVSDFTCGFKMFRAHVSRILFAQSQVHRWAFDSEILFLAQKQEYHIVELPVTWENDADTRVNLISELLPTLWDLFRIRLFLPYPRISDTHTESGAETDQKPPSKKYLLGIFLIACVLLGRVVIFLATQDVGIEHDSAWYLGVAKNIAEKGLYASYTNTSKTEETVSKSIHGRYSVQDKNGLTYFPAGVTTGPGYIFPQAFIFKLFGFGFWQYRAIPLFGYALLMFLLLYLAYTLGGIISVGILSLFLYARFDLFVNQSFEAFSEHIALVYLLVTVSILSRLKRERVHIPEMVFGGFFFSFAFLTKNLSLLAFPGILFLLIPLGVFFHHAFVIWFRRVLYLTFGFILPIVGFELYKYFSLVSRFGKDAYTAVQLDQRLHFLSGGSGLLSIRSDHIPFILKKIDVLRHISSMLPLLIWMLSFAFLYVVWKYKFKMKQIITSLWIIMITQTLWFIFLSQSGWFRHNWQSVVLLILFFSLAGSYVFNKMISSTRIKFVCICMSVYVLLSSVNALPFSSPFISKNAVNTAWRSESPNDLQGPVFSPVFSWKDAQQLVAFLDKSVPKNQKIYYVDTFLVTEIATLSRTVLYSHERIKYDANSYPLLLLGPYQRGQISIRDAMYEREFVKEYCEKTVFINPSYRLCKSNGAKIRSLIP